LENRATKNLWSMADTHNANTSSAAFVLELNKLKTVKYSPLSITNMRLPILAYNPPKPFLSMPYNGTTRPENQNKIRIQQIQSVIVY